MLLRLFIHNVFKSGIAYGVVSDQFPFVHDAEDGERGGSIAFES